MEYTGNIPTNSDYINDAKKHAGKYKNKHKPGKIWNSNELFYESVTYFSSKVILKHDIGIIIAQLEGNVTFKKRVPEMSLELPKSMKRKQVIERFKKYGFDKYETK